MKNRVVSLAQIDLIEVICHKYLASCQKKEMLFEKITIRAKHVLKLVHFNIIGLLSKVSLSG